MTWGENPALNHPGIIRVRLACVYEDRTLFATVQACGFVLQVPSAPVLKVALLKFHDYCHAYRKKIAASQSDRQVFVLKHGLTIMDSVWPNVHVRDMASHPFNKLAFART